MIVVCSIGLSYLITSSPIRVVTFRITLSRTISLTVSPVICRHYMRSNVFCSGSVSWSRVLYSSFIPKWSSATGMGLSRAIVARIISASPRAIPYSQFPNFFYCTVLLDYCWLFLLRYSWYTCVLCNVFIQSKVCKTASIRRFHCIQLLSLTISIRWTTGNDPTAQRSSHG